MCPAVAGGKPSITGHLPLVSLFSSPFGLRFDGVRFGPSSATAEPFWAMPPAHVMSARAARPQQRDRQTIRCLLFQSCRFTRGHVVARLVARVEFWRRAAQNSNAFHILY